MSRSVSNADLSLEQLLLAAVENGNTQLVGVGGDGTHHDIINAIVRYGFTDLITYTPLPFGSGNDWCRTLGISRHLLRWLDTVKRGKTIDHRIGRLDYLDREGNKSTRYFVNVAGLAFDAEVVRRAADQKYKHRLLYPLMTLACLPSFTPPQLKLTFDGRVVEGAFHTINIGIGRYNGGGMRLVPQADPTAETFALTYAEALPVARILANGWRFFTESIGRVEGVTTTHAHMISVTGPTGLEADGEYLGTAPIKISMLAERLRVSSGD